MIEVKNLFLKYGQEKQEEWVLKNLNLKVAEEECLSILGESGCGKSTLLHVMSGLLKPTKGEILYQDKPFYKPNKDITMVFQDYGLLPWKTVKQNLILPIQIRREKIDKMKLKELIEYLHLEEHINKYPGQLSGGQKQRVAFGKAVLSKSRVILMDEPFSALDIGNKEKLQKFTKHFLKDTHMTAVIVTHSLEEAVHMGDRIAVFDAKNGTIRTIVDNQKPIYHNQEPIMINEKINFIKGLLQNEEKDYKYIS